jgi:leucyl aminopeptidase (aminopeptidase T)
MIANERQYRITRTAARELEEALARLETVEAYRPPELRRVMREAMESQFEELREELADDEALRGGKVGVLELTSLAELPEALIGHGSRSA